MNKVLSSCERSGRVCGFAKRQIGEDVLAILLENKTENGFFDVGVLARLYDYFGISPAETVAYTDCVECIRFDRMDCRPDWDLHGEICSHFKRGKIYE